MLLSHGTSVPNMNFLRLQTRKLFKDKFYRSISLASGLCCHGNNGFHSNDVNTEILLSHGTSVPNMNFVRLQTRKLFKDKFYRSIGLASGLCCHGNNDFHSNDENTEMLLSHLTSVPNMNFV